MCFVSFVKNYFEYKKYNFNELGRIFNEVILLILEVILYKAYEAHIAYDIENKNVFRCIEVDFIRGIFCLKVIANHSKGIFSFKTAIVRGFEDATVFKRLGIVFQLC